MSAYPSKAVVKQFSHFTAHGIVPSAFVILAKAADSINDTTGSVDGVMEGV